MRFAIRENLTLLGILILAFLLRLVGIGYGLPHFVIGDEQSFLYGSLKLLELKTLFPVLYPEIFRPLYYPPGLPYIFDLVLAPWLGIKYLLSGLSFEVFKTRLMFDQADIWLVLRLVVVFFGVGTVYLVWRMANRLFNRETAHWAALLLALSFLHVNLSHFARHWVPAVFFTMLYLAVGLNIYYKPRTKYYIYTGLLAGLAFGISYITCVGLVAVLLAHYLSDKDRWYKIFFKINLAYLFFPFISVSGLFIILHPQEFIRILWGEDSTVAVAKSLADFAGAYWYHLINLFSLEPLLLVMGIFGGYYAFRRNKSAFGLLLVVPVFFIAALYLFFHNEVRYVIFVLPFLAVFGGYGANIFIAKFKSKNIGRGALICLFLFPTLVLIKYDILLLQKDTRELGLEWIEKNISPSEKIATDFYDFRLTPTKNSVAVQEKLWPDSLRQLDHALLKLADSEYPDPAYDILPLHFIAVDQELFLREYIKKNNYRYFAVSYYDFNELTPLSRDLLLQGEFRQEFKADGKLKNESLQANWRGPIWDIFSVNILGPNFVILKLPS